MLDPKTLDPKLLTQSLQKRGIKPAPVVDGITKLKAQRTELIQQVEALRAKRNQLAKKGGGDEAARTQAVELKKQLQTLEQTQRTTEQALRDILLNTPNILDDSVPLGLEPKSVASSKTSVPEFGFTPKSHSELGEALGLMDFKQAAQMSGARFVVLKGALAKLERVLAGFMLEHNTLKAGYEEISPPILVKDAALIGTAQLPKFAEDLFSTTSDHWLIPTAEVPLTNLVANKTTDEAMLPFRWTALTPCFRSEAGAAGKDTKGMIRQHQFQKVEMVSVTVPDQSEEEHQRMTANAESLLDQLGLCWRRVLLAAEDTGFAARKTYDLEVWLPSQEAFREISSCSNCGDFQARRMNARLKQGGFVHTLNGSGLAVGRTLIAILENYQTEKGEILIPKILQPLMGMEKLTPANGK